MNNQSQRMDIFISLFFIFYFSLISVVYLNRDILGVLDFIIIGIIFSLSMLTYFNGIISGLVSSALIIFIYATYIIYNNVVNAREVTAITYLWMAAIPINIFISGGIHNSAAAMQGELIRLQREYKELITIDEATGLDNLKSFYTGLDKDLSLSKRHGFKLTLMIIRISYYDELYGILGETRMRELLRCVGEVISKSTRNEDKRYKLSNDTMAILMPQTEIKGAEVVKNRIKEGIREINLKSHDAARSIAVEARIGIYEYNPGIKDAFEFKELAERELEYDV